MLEMATEINFSPENLKVLSTVKHFIHKEISEHALI